jgi:dihydrofolate synthase / folylpolyglutamate synthase
MEKDRFQTFEDVSRYLESMPRFQMLGASAANFSLDAIRAFCVHMGDPQNSFRSVHIAGTNGKGTTAHMLHSVYMAEGYVSGLFTSPHLLKFNERFRINGRQIEDEVLLQFFHEYGHLTSTHRLTFFELSVAIAFWYFRKIKVDVAIIETGLGGRLDATNIITPACSVITSIAMDHTDLLGDTLQLIAAEKGGIIKPGVQVICGDLPAIAREVIRHIAEQNGSPLIEALELQPEYTPGIIRMTHPECGPLIIRPDIAGPVQAKNAAMAVSVVHTLSSFLPVSCQALTTGLETAAASTGLMGRYEKLLPDANWYFDGGHNAEALSHLPELLYEIADLGASTAVIALNRDKATKDVLNFYKAFKSVYFYRMDGDRSADFENIARHIPDAVFINPANEETSGPLLRFNREELVIFSGSFYFYPVVKRWLASLEPS